MRQIASWMPWLEICLALKRRRELYMPEIAQVLVKKLEIAQKTFVILSETLQDSYLHKTATMLSYLFVKIFQCNRAAKINLYVGLVTLSLTKS